MGTKPQSGKIATFGVRFESHDHFLVEYTDHLRRGFLVLPQVRSLAEGDPVRIKLSLPNRGILYLSGLALSADHPDAGGKGTLVRLSNFNREQERMMELCVSAVIGAHAEATPAEKRKPIDVLLLKPRAARAMSFPAQMPAKSRLSELLFLPQPPGPRAPGGWRGRCTARPADL